MPRFAPYLREAVKRIEPIDRDAYQAEKDAQRARNPSHPMPVARPSRRRMENTSRRPALSWGQSLSVDR